MPKKSQRYIVVQVIVSIPKAGEFKVGIPIAAVVDLNMSAAELTDLADFEVCDRLRVKLDKGEHARFIRASKRK